MRWGILLLGMMLVLSGNAEAQSAPGAEAAEPGGAADQVLEEAAGEADSADAADASEGDAPVEEPQLPFEYITGPATGAIGDLAAIAVPEEYLFVDRANVGAFLESSGNMADGDELGILLSSSESGEYWALFVFDDIGYIQDADKEELNADEMLESMREGTAASNEARRERGLAEMELLGWHTPPFYNPETQRLEWGLRYRSDNGETVNYHTRILGRHGVMRVIIVASPEDLPMALPAVQRDLAGFTFNDGQRYAQWTQGDKLASVGLAALVAGGAGAAVAKAGLLKKLWKVIVFGVIGLFAAVRRFFRKEHVPQNTLPPDQPDTTV